MVGAPATAAFVLQFAHAEPVGDQLAGERAIFSQFLGGRSRLAWPVADAQLIRVFPAGGRGAPGPTGC